MKYKRNKSVRYSYTRHQDSYDYSVFIYNPDTGKDYIFNNVAAFIWEQLGDSNDTGMLVDYMLEVGIAADRKTISFDIEKLLLIFSNHGLVEMVE